jgi:beta-lactamase class D
MKPILKTAVIISLAVGLAGCETAAMLVLNSTEQTSIAVKGDKLFIMGLLNSKTFGQMQKSLAANPQIETLVFTAMPGSIDDEVTFEMGRWLRAKKLNTHLTAKTVIASGAVDLFLSGSQRTMEAGAQLGVHSWSDGSKEAADYPRDSEEHALNRDYIVDLGVPEDFYWFTIYEAPANAIHWMSQGEVVKYGLLTAPILTSDSSAAIPFKDFAKMRLEILED